MPTYTIATITLATGAKHVRTVVALDGKNVIRSLDIPAGERGLYVLTVVAS
jgi:hypothetical protein